MFSERFNSFLFFILQQRKPNIFGIGVLLVIALFAYSYFGGLGGINDFWNSYLNTLFSFATLMVAIAVWLGEAYEDWQTALPCKLTSIFIYKNQEVMRCDFADLSSEGDMRALGQSIGSQMCGGTQLSIKMPEIQRTGGELKTDLDGNVFRHFTIQFTLRNPPNEIKDGYVLCWSPPFELDPELKLVETVHS